MPSLSRTLFLASRIQTDPLPHCGAFFFFTSLLIPFRVKTNWLEFYSESAPNATKPQPKPPALADRKLTVKQMAERWNVCERTIERWMSQGWVPYTKIGRNVRFEPLEADAALHSKFGRNRAGLK